MTLFVGGITAQKQPCTPAQYVVRVEIVGVASAALQENPPI
jgi:hypothetical protein